MSHVMYRSIVPFDFYGLQIRELTPDSLKTASVAEIEIVPGAKHDTARSIKSDKIYICTEGKVRFIVDKKPVVLKPTDLLFIEKGKWFSYSSGSTKTSRVILIHIPPFDGENEQFLNKVKSDSSKRVKNSKGARD